MKRSHLLVLSASIAAVAFIVARADNGGTPSEKEQRAPSPLVEHVRRATARYQQLGGALSDGFVQGTACVSGPNSGAMGVHYVRVDRIKGAVLNADEPEALIYEPLADGGYRLVGVEYIILKSVWDQRYPNGPTPDLDGTLLNLVTGPNRYGLPDFYELHVWAWEPNPNGSFADWNTHVHCEMQPFGENSLLPVP